MNFTSLFESVTDVWLVWLVTLVILTIWFRNMMSKFRWSQLRRFHRSECGASYALPYVMSFTLMVVIMGMFLQATLILMAKVGTMYAAHSAARAYVVWKPAANDVTVFGNGFDFPRMRAKRAATMAMVPFASSSLRHRKKLFPLFPLIWGSGEDFLPSSATGLLVYSDRVFYEKAYRRILQDANSNSSGGTSPIINSPRAGVTKKYIYNKYAYAAAATAVYTPDGIAAWNDDVTIKVRYRMPFQIPGMAKIFGGVRSWFGWGDTVYRDIESVVTLPSEAAKTPSGTLTIPYQPSLLLR